MFIPAIAAAREWLDRRCSDEAPFGARAVRKFSGIRSDDIYRLEKSGVIPPVRRAGNGRRVWSCEELIGMLKKIEEHKMAQVPKGMAA